MITFVCMIDDPYWIYCMIFIVWYWIVRTCAWLWGPTNWGPWLPLHCGVWNPSRCASRACIFSPDFISPKWDQKAGATVMMTGEPYAYHCISHVQPRVQVWLDYQVCAQALVNSKWLLLRTSSLVASNLGSAAATAGGYGCFFVARTVRYAA